jgi:putative DNA primase/helicase
MLASGVDPGQEPLIDDGKIHRFRGPGDKPGRKNCWYILFSDGGGSFGSWRLGVEEIWSPRNGRFAEADRQRIEDAKRKAEADRECKRSAASAKAQNLWERGIPVRNREEHLYLVAKGIQPHGIRRMAGLPLLLVPLSDTASAAPVNLQIIGTDGTKRFLAGGRVAGCYFSIADKPLSPELSEIYIAEGFATAATVHEASGCPTAVAFNACNLRAVAEGLRGQYPKAKITICADDDRNTDGNPGVRKATEAARAVQGLLAVPKFPDGIGGTDFNDLAASSGLDAVRAQLGGARKPAAAEIPANFKLTKDMVYVLRERTTKDRGVEVLEDPVCSRLEVVALTRDNMGCEWGRLLRFRDPDGREHEWAMPTSMLAAEGAEYRARLLEQGLTIWPTREARLGLHEYLAQCRPVARARAVTRLGWHEGVFVLPDETFGEAGVDRTLYQSATAFTHAFNVSGSLEDWRREVSARCAGNSRLILSVSASFAAPLLHFTGDESGGFNLVGRSSLGKTTALRAAGSVWGGSQAAAGYLQQWRATANGLEGVAAAHCDTLLPLDELSEVGAKEAGNIAYMLANGKGKARAHRDGSVRRCSSWRLLFLSSGEITLADKIREDARLRVTAGQQVRILDIPAECGSKLGLFEDIHDARNGQEFADQLKAATQSYYGTAARALLGEIAKRPERFAETIRNHRNDFIAEYCPEGADGQIRRAATRFGLVAAAGELATALQIAGWEAGEATWAAGTCFLAWLARRGHIGPAEIEDGIEKIRRFFALHGDSRFSPDGDSANGRPTINRAGFRKNGNFYVFPEIFRSEIAAGFEWHSLAAALVERGMLVMGKDGKLQVTVRNPDGGKTIRMFCFTPAVLADEELAGSPSEEERPLYEDRPFCRISTIIKRRQR